MIKKIVNEPVGVVCRRRDCFLAAVIVYICTVAGGILGLLAFKLWGSNDS